MQPLTVLRTFFYGRYVRSIQYLQNSLKKEKNQGWQWLFHQCRSLKKILGVARKKFTWVGEKNFSSGENMSAAITMNKDIDLSSNAADTVTRDARTTAIGTATPSRCPMQTI